MQQPKRANAAKRASTIHSVALKRVTDIINSTSIEHDPFIAARWRLSHDTFRSSGNFCIPPPPLWQLRLIAQMMMNCIALAGCTHLIVRTFGRSHQLHFRLLHALHIHRVQHEHNAVRAPSDHQTTETPLAT